MPIQDRDYYRERSGTAPRPQGGSARRGGGGRVATAVNPGAGGSSGGHGWCWLILLLLIVGIGGGYYWYTQHGLPIEIEFLSTPTPTPQAVREGAFTPTPSPAPPTSTPYPCADPTPTSDASGATPTPALSAPPVPPATPTSDRLPEPLSDEWREGAGGWNRQQVDAALVESLTVFDAGLDDLGSLPLAEACVKAAVFEVHLEMAEYLVSEHRLERESVPGQAAAALSWTIWLRHQRGLFVEAVQNHAPVAECRGILAPPTPTPTPAPAPPTATVPAVPTSTPLPPCPTATPTPLPTATPTATATPTPTATPTATATPPPTSTPPIERGDARWIAALEQEVHRLVNQQRVQHGLSRLGSDKALAAIARSHSADMARNKFFSHDNLQGQSASDRGAAEGYDCHKDYGTYYTFGLAENISWSTLYSRYQTRNGIIVSKDYYGLEELAFLVVDGWMNSSGHRENILTGSYDVEGIGVAVNSDEEVYVTQNFC